MHFYINSTLIFSLIFVNFFSIRQVLSSQNNKDLSIDFKTEKIDNNFQYENQFLLNETEYILGPGDKIKILFYEPKSLTNIFEIMANGKAVIPYLGPTELNNLTLEKAKEKLKKEFERVIISSAFDLIILEPRPIKVTLIGEINSPGIYTLPIRIANYQNVIDDKQFKDDNLKYHPTILDALKISGGINPNSDLESIELKRKFIVNNKIIYKSKNINLINLYFKGEQDNNIILFDGDIINIKKNKVMRDDHFKIINANLSPLTMPIYVTGEVKDPGLINVPINTTLVDSILMAGGPLMSRANKSKVQIVRKDQNGSISVTNFKINIRSNLSDDKNPKLKKDDVIFVQSTSLANTSDTLKTFTSPLRDIISVWTLIKLIQD